MTLMLATLCASFAPTTAAPLRIEQGDLSVRVLAGDRPILTYTYDQGLPKPFIHPLLTPAGHEVTQTEPPGHVHHRGLMFALGSVTFAGEEGHVVFWGEEGPPPNLGHIEHKGFESLKATKDRAVMVSRLEWRRRSDDALMLSEKRRLVVYAPQDLPCNLITWASDLTAPDRDIILGGTPGRDVSYYGLGLRVPADMDGGQIVDANGKTGEQAVMGDDARWCAYLSAKQPARGFAMFDYPRNPRYPTGWFVMSADFGYMTASIVAHEPLTLPAGQTLKLRYGICAFDGSPSADQLETWHQRWLKLKH